MTETISNGENQFERKTSRPRNILIETPAEHLASLTYSIEINYLLYSPPF